MGALLGALYAMGYTADQIERLAREANWFHLLSNEEPLEEVAIDLKPNVGKASSPSPAEQKADFRTGISRCRILQKCVPLLPSSTCYILTGSIWQQQHPVRTCTQIQFGCPPDHGYTPQQATQTH